MRSLHKLVMNGQILYPAISDTPAWVRLPFLLKCTLRPALTELNCEVFARVRSSPRQTALRGPTLSHLSSSTKVSGTCRSEISSERLSVRTLAFALLQNMTPDLSTFPFCCSVSAMCRKEGLGLAPWGVIGQGKFMSAAQVAERKSNGEKFRGGADELSEKDLKMSEALEKVAGELGEGATVTSVALAWALLKFPYVFPIGAPTFSFFLVLSLFLGVTERAPSVGVCQSGDARSPTSRPTSTPSLTTSPPPRWRRSRPFTRSSTGSLTTVSAATHTRRVGPKTGSLGRRRGCSGSKRSRRSDLLPNE